LARSAKAKVFGMGTNWFASVHSSASHWAGAALVHERHRFRAAHVADLKPIELKAGLLDQRANGAIKMA
jgi:hypothetical protein